MGVRLLTLADKMRELAQPYGIEVIEVAGWQARGYDLIQPDISLRHWTAGPPTGVFPSYSTLINGRSDLPGPLCNTAQSREPVGSLDKIYIIAGGKANHAGSGSWNGVVGNYYSLGHEIEWSGPGEFFPITRIFVSEVALRGLMSFCGDNANDACEHREYAPTRKIDTNLDGNHLRQVIRTGLYSWTPSQPPQEEEMPPVIFGAPAEVNDSRIFITDGVNVIHIKNWDTVGWLQYTFVKNNVIQRPTVTEWEGLLWMHEQSVGRVGIIPEVDEKALAEALGPLLKPGASPTEIATVVKTTLQPLFEAIPKAVTDEIGS